MDLTSALETYREAMTSTQTSFIKLFIEQLAAIPQSMRPAERGEICRDDKDVRLDVFYMWFSRGRYGGIGPITTLEELSAWLPQILKNPGSAIDGVLEPVPDEVREQYLQTLHELVMAKAKPEHAPPSLPAEYEALLKLTDGLQTLDLLNERICEVGVVKESRAEVEALVPDLDELQSYVNWPISAGFYLGVDHESNCVYVYCRNISDDADEHEREWAWRIMFESFSFDTQDEYIGDLVGFLRYYPHINLPEHVPKHIGYRIRDIHSFAIESPGNAYWP
ncbi:hypothetical protein F4777DRAFT_576742 [Nemania sp. FL0916]|nr:hypothetical protein F4777DRAFT_576742 [Nemania sp. FL0916]